MARTDHGRTRYFHRTDPCRCVTCRTAGTAYLRERRAVRLAEGRVMHGVPSGYTTGCRCLECTAAMARYQAAWRARRAAL